MTVNQKYIDEMNALYDRAVMEIGKKLIAFYTGRDIGLIALYNDASVCFNVGRAIRRYNYDLYLISDANLIKYREILGNMLIKYTKPIFYNYVLDDQAESDPVIPVLTPVIYAGTSSGGLILRSLDLGLTFEVYGTSLYGNPSCLAVRELTGDVYYGTNTGYFINLTQNTLVDGGRFTNGPGINSIYVGDVFGVAPHSNGVKYTNLVTGEWNYNISTGYSFEEEYFNGGLIDGGGTDNDIFATRNGIIRVFSAPEGDIETVQAGDFRSICNIGGGVLYAGTFNGHVWKSIDNGITWSDHATVTTVAIVSIIENNGRIIISDQYSSSTIWYTDDDFDTVIESTGMIGSNNRIIAVNDSVLLVANGTGDIWRSENNGESFSEILGNPQQGESSINDLILNYEYL